MSTKSNRRSFLENATLLAGRAFSAQSIFKQPGEGQTNAENDWQTLVSDINDPQNLCVGDINYWVVLGGKGAVDQFVKIGG